MGLRYRASYRQLLLTCGLAALASIGTWLTAVRFQDARTARREAHTSEAILNDCQALTGTLDQLSKLADNVVHTDTAADVVAFRAVQKTWRDQTAALWNGVRMDPDALRLFAELVQAVQRWDDRYVEAKLAGAPVSPMAPQLLDTAQQSLQALVAQEKALYATRLTTRTAPAMDFLVYGLGTLLLLAAAGYFLRRDAMQHHFDPLTQLSLSAQDLLEGEGLVAPPTTGGQELLALSRTVHQLGLRYLTLRGDQHQLVNLLGSLAELGALRQTRPPSAFYTLLIEQVARHVEARSAAIAVLDGPMLRLVAQYGEDSGHLHVYLHDLLAAVQEKGDLIAWSESNEFPDHLREELVDHRCHAAMAVPLFDRGMVNGLMVVWHGAGRAWPETQRAYLRAASGLITFGEAAGVPATKPVKGAIGESIASARDGRQRQWALDRAIAEAIEPYDNAIVKLMLLQPDGKTMTVSAARGLPSSEWDGSRCLLGEGLTGRAVAHCRWENIPDMSSKIHLVVNPFVRQWGPRSAALAPLPDLGSVRGVLVVFSREPDAFAKAEPHLMAIASQIALGLQGAQGNAVAVEASHSWDIVAEASKTIQLATTPEGVARAWVAGVREAFTVESSALYLLNPAGELVLAAAQGKAQKRLNTSACFATQRGDVCGSDGTECTHCASHDAGPGHICLPLSWQGQIVGMATVQGPSPSYWTPGRIHLATALAELIAFGLVAGQHAWRGTSR